MRPLLVPLIPSVIGLTSDDVHVDAAIALGSARAALPIAAAPRQNVLATAVIRCERVLAELDGRDEDTLSPQSLQVLDQVPEAATAFGGLLMVSPEAAAWARSFSSGLRVARRTFRAQTAPHILNIAVESITLACAPDVERRLVDLLADTISDCQALILTDTAPKHRMAAELTWQPHLAQLPASAPPAQ